MAGIDVVDVMEIDAEDADGYRANHLGVSERSLAATRADSCAAKTALCALIDATGAAVALLEGIAPHHPQTTALREALANCRGGTN